MSESPPAPEEVARAAVGDTGTCQVCREQVRLRKDGIPIGTHKWTVLLNPDADPEYHATTVSECPGSNLPPVEYAQAYEAARFSKKGATTADPASRSAAAARIR